MNDAMTMARRCVCPATFRGSYRDAPFMRSTADQRAHLVSSACPVLPRGPSARRVKSQKYRRRRQTSSGPLSASRKWLIIQLFFSVAENTVYQCRKSASRTHCTNAGLLTRAHATFGGPRICWPSCCYYYVWQ